MIQVVKFKCCGKIFSACAEPYCYTDNDYVKDLKKYVNQGHKVEMVENGTGIRFEKCECKKEPTLF